MKYSFSYLNTPDNLYSFCYENFNTLKNEDKQLLLTRVIKEQDILTEKKIYYASDNQLRNINSTNNQYNGNKEKVINITNNNHYITYHKENKKINVQEKQRLISRINQKNIFDYNIFLKLQNNINKQIKDNSLQKHNLINSMNNHIEQNKALYGYIIPKKDIIHNNTICNLKIKEKENNINIKQFLSLSYNNIKKQYKGNLKTDNLYGIIDIENSIQNSSLDNNKNLILKDINYNIKKNKIFLLKLLNNNLNDFAQPLSSKVLLREQKSYYNSSEQNKVLDKKSVENISIDKKDLYNIIKNTHKNIDNINNIKDFIKIEQSDILNYNTTIYNKNKKNYKKIDNTLDFDIYHKDIIKNTHKKISTFKNYKNVSDTIRGKFYLENNKQHIKKRFKDINIIDIKKSFIEKTNKEKNIIANKLLYLNKEINKNIHFHNDNKIEIGKNIYKKINIDTTIQHYQKNYNKKFFNKVFTTNHTIKSYINNTSNINTDFDNIKTNIEKNVHKEGSILIKENNLIKYIKSNISIATKKDNNLINVNNKTINKDVQNDKYYGQLYTHQYGILNDKDKLLKSNVINNIEERRDLQSYFTKNIRHNITKNKKEETVHKKINKNTSILSKEQHKLKSQDRRIYVEDKERLGTLHKRLWFIKGIGEIDYKILPNIDYQYPAPINIFVEQPDFQYYFEYKTFCDEYFNGEYIIELYDYDYNIIDILKTNNVSEKEISNNIISLKISKEVFNEINEDDREHYKFEIKINYPKVNYIIIRQPTNTFDNEVLYTVTEKFLGENKHPIPFGDELGLREIPVHINIMVEFINVLLLLWQQRFVAFGGLLGIHGVYGLVNLVYEWLTLETSIENNEYIEEYNRCFRWLRWEAEKTYNLAKADTKLNANNWINFMINEMIDYVEMHHIDIIPILENIMKTDDWRNQFSDATLDIQIILDKMKGKRKRIISNQKMGLSLEPTQI